MKNKLHLICNAHIDPVWLWEWEEGAAEAISTFRVAADFCEAYEGFVFNHNEAILYRWVEEYEPTLFKRIQKLVKEGKWHIMGGWYLQPDCNMPSGESFVRQILSGRTYFKDKFNVDPVTALNFDPFGHTRGLVQILKKAGYDSYIFCRPQQNDCPLPDDEFTWVGYDGSEIIGHRAFGSYLTNRGEARQKVSRWLDAHKDKPEGMVLWGIGNHGGGPSRIDMTDLQHMMEETEVYEIIHSTPEAYFKELKENKASLPRHEKDLNAWAVGCYTSQVRIKKQHRLLENEIYMVEKMMACAAIQGYVAYPGQELHEALRDLMTAEFHDILPGSSIQPAEDAALRLMAHGLEIISRLKARAFFALAGGQKKAEEGDVPVLVYNPHPYKVKGHFTCEFQLPDQNWKQGFSLPIVYQDGNKIPSQAEKEHSNLNLDWRKRIVFAAELEPGQMNRFDCKIEVLPAKPALQASVQDGKLSFETHELSVTINSTTGLMDSYKVNGVEFIKENAFLPLVIEDDEDAWGSRVRSFPKVAGAFKLMSAEEGTRFSGVAENLLDSVRVIEDGAVRTVVEAVFSYGDSFICQRYKLPKQGTEIETETRVYWNEKSKMLKLSIPTVLENGQFFGQVAYGAADLPADGKEAVAQKWVAVTQEVGAVTCINDGTYGCDFKQGEMRLSLLRSPGYSALPVNDRPLMNQEQFSPRIDQGERVFSFWLNAGPSEERMEKISLEAMVHNEKPFVLSFYPSGTGTSPKPLAVLSDEAVQMTAFKKAEDGKGYVMRVFNTTGQNRETTIEIPAIGINNRVRLGPFEIKTFRVDADDKKLTEVDLLER